MQLDLVFLQHQVVLKGITAKNFKAQFNTIELFGNGFVTHG
jgi:hypothetical protein